MNLLNQVVEDQRFLEAQSAISRFAIYRTKRQLTYSNLQNLLANFRTNLKADAILASSVKRSLFWRYLRDENLLQLLLCYEDCQEAKLRIYGSSLLSLLRHIGLSYLTPGKPYYIGDEGAESVDQLDREIAAYIEAGAAVRVPPSLEIVMAYLLDRLNDHVGNFIDGPYGHMLASFENYALKPRVMRDFEKLRLLGEGGFGKVHAVRVV
ncbi:G protein-coupled receptor kinase 5 [Hondaea fermentalgiana]|uniref:G protein-coupled receptor kinase 5 n=1 Tax=Hondaea fermentalgiana TaxID=2315210 RepID=A0A2R5H0B9_9STRA|nr:G protein-coupled receptor kinase 5 [Hondaea fermentalgiana]|eukprot:GBG34503.1 G protein-coupled receptor kinase 5 [Hondaea fermentalgiana]